MPKGHFEIWQKACGLTYAKCCLLLDKQLRWSHILQPAKQYCHDWTHCLVSAGIIQVAIYMICSIFLLALVGPRFMITWNCGYAHSTCHNIWRLCSIPNMLRNTSKTRNLVARPVKPWALCQFWIIWWKHCCFPKDLIQNLLGAAEQCLAKWVDAGLQS